MELREMADALKDKSILLTGSTGFLAKIFVEKVLRVQPNVKKLYLLVRAGDAQYAKQRMQREIIEKELFHVLREQHGKNFLAFISEKICAIAGDITLENLGIQSIDLRELLWKEIHMVINVAATTNFYDRYDVALNVNVLGAKHAMEFAKRCNNIEMVLHVSTAYVTGEKQGLLLERAFCMGEALKDNMYLDIEAELKLVERRKQELHLENQTKLAEKMAMKELGIERARHFGWPNTYVFTKAMGEMLVGQLRGTLPLVIARPTIITSIWKEPLPGWIEGNRTIDNIIVGYVKGNLPCIAADTDAPMDVIPGDMVVNAMIAMLVIHSNQQSEFTYHISSSVRNPVKYSILEKSGYRYFADKPRFAEDGREIRVYKVPVFKTMSSFRLFFFLRYRLPLEVSTFRYLSGTFTLNKTRP
ncbi:Alcohol-forming fatty acyl-CoA reductase [Apostasia shenzhenica]|uniref:Fatty acyl-CoA reductase n=1 Tax=Apostasia shenzhenica TaxID=1088818 RepID=A0A2I0BGB4_9ASPA|nr:Alcohol-forming fatty acyl-CoA reductase [Apostasia shenzhenica]